ncbi:MAG: dihydropteroate synthase [bacterium]
MGILNVTPDSFSDGGRYSSSEQVVDAALQMSADGADFIDIGGESTRPGSQPVSTQEELGRVLPVIEELSRRSDIPISIDTYKSNVAAQALQAGAVIVNDISGGLADSGMIDVVARYHASMILMHMQGTPRTMQGNPVYKNVVQEIIKFLEMQQNKAKAAGIEQVIVDPGIGFGKNLDHNIEIIRMLTSFHKLSCPILMGVSRKSFIGKILDLPVGQRMEGTAAAVAVCIQNGANIVRVHDVKQMKRVALIVDRLKSISADK